MHKNSQSITRQLEKIMDLKGAVGILPTVATLTKFASSISIVHTLTELFRAITALFCGSDPSDTTERNIFSTKS